MNAFTPLLLAAAAATGGAVLTTLHALRRWLRANGEARRHKVVLEVDGRRVELTGRSPIELERAIHDQLSPPPTATPAV